MAPLPPAWFLLSIVAMGVLHVAGPVATVPPAPWNAAGAVPLAAGIAVAVAANRLFRKRGTSVHPHAEASTLVVQGPFRYTRNPMYLGLALALAGLAALLGTLTPWVVVPAFVVVISRLFIRGEEDRLEQQFGAEYVAYRRRVRRWI